MFFHLIDVQFPVNFALDPKFAKTRDFDHVSAGSKESITVVFTVPAKEDNAPSYIWETRDQFLRHTNRSVK